MSSLLNLLLEQRLILLMLGLAVLLLVGSVVLLLITELRARARRRRRQREREEREARLAEQAEALAVAEAIDDALTNIVPAPPPPVPSPAPAPVIATQPAEGTATPGTDGTAAAQGDAAPATEAAPDPAGDSAPKPKIAVNLFAGKPEEKPLTVEQVKAEPAKADAPKAAGGGDAAFGELFSGVFDDEAAARMQMMLSGSEPVTMEALAAFSQRVANSLTGAESAAEPAGDGEPS